MNATLADLRERVFDSIAADPRRMLSDYVVRELTPHLVRGASDADLIRCFAKLDPTEEVRGLAFAAVERERAALADSARSLLRLAESKVGSSGDPDRRPLLLEALAPAWWRLGEGAKADAMFQAVLDDAARLDSAGFHERLVSTAAMGKRADLVATLLPRAFEPKNAAGIGSVKPGLAAALEDGEDAIADAILGRIKDATPRRDWSRVHGTLTHVAPLRPRKVLELWLRWRDLVGTDEYALALRELERRDPREAVDVAMILLEQFRETTTALAILAAHDPAAAERAMADAVEYEHEPSIARLAAMGRVEECRAHLTVETGHPELREAMYLTPDPALAVDLTHALVSRELDLFAWEAAALADLGDDEWLDGQLDARMEAIRAGADSQASTRAVRDPHARLRMLVRAAAQAGRTALARSLLEPVESVPESAVPEELQLRARMLVSSAADAGDYDTALAALERVPEIEPGDRLGSAVTDLLEVALKSPYRGARAVPLRARSTSYVRSWIARGDRAVVEWIAVASNGRLPPEAQVEIDRFLERG